MICRDKYGWPVELIIGRPVTNFIRLMIHTNLRQTWFWRDPKHDHGIVTDSGVGSSEPIRASLAEQVRT